MDPDESSIFSVKGVYSAMEIVWNTLKVFFNQQPLQQSAVLSDVSPLISTSSERPTPTSLANSTSLETPTVKPETLPRVAILGNLVLPQTLLLRCFSFVNLKCLIHSRCVCSDWRKLVPLSDIHPVRRRFLKLYDRMLANEFFLESRIWTLDNLKSFDRESYIASLTEQCAGPEAEIPEDFRMYILEWPARMAIANIWPGLPFVDSQTGGVQRQVGINHLARSPELSALVFKHQLPGACFIPGLLIWRTPTDTTWLLFDKTPHDGLDFRLHGRVFEIALYPTPPHLDQVNDASVIPYACDDESNDSLYYEIFNGIYPEYQGWTDVETFIIHRSWMTYLEFGWSIRTEPYVSPHTRRIYHVQGSDTEGHPDVSLDDIVEKMNEEGYEYLNRSYRDVPAPPWTRRGEPKFKERLVTGSIPPGSNVRVYLRDYPHSYFDSCVIN